MKQKIFKKIAFVIIVSFSIFCSYLIYLFFHMPDSAETLLYYQNSVPETASFEGNFTVSQGYIQTGLKIFARGWSYANYSYTMNISLKNGEMKIVPVTQMNCNYSGESIYLGEVFPTDDRTIYFYGNIFTPDGNLGNSPEIPEPCITFEEVYSRESRAIWIVFLITVAGISFNLLWEFYKVFIENYQQPPHLEALCK